MGRDFFQELDRSDYLRVTECLKPFSGIEFVPAKYLEPAANFGTQCHYHIQNLLSGFETPIEDDRIEPVLNSFARFWQDSLHAFADSKIIIEKRLYDDENKITGCIDCVIVTDEKTYVFDWKTSKAMHKETWRLQSAGYRYLLEVNGFTNVTNPVFVQLMRDGKEPKLFSSETYDEDLERFFNCLDLFRFFRMDKTRNKWGN